MPDRSNEVEPYVPVEEPTDEYLYDYLVKNILPHADEKEASSFKAMAIHGTSWALTYATDLQSAFDWMSFDFLGDLYKWASDYGETEMAELFVESVINFKKRDLESEQTS